MDSPFGSLVTAMVTPFKPDSEIDYQKAERLVEILIEKGSDSLVISGTTGESPTLSAEEKLALFKVAVGAAKGRVKVIASTGNNWTKATVDFCREAEKTGVDGFLIVAPYYNKPPQEGLYRHFKEIAAAVGLPIMLYNIPGRTGVNMLPETTLRLAEIDNIVAIKETSGDIDQISAICAGAPEGFYVYSGDDSFLLPVLGVGGRGVVSAVGNIAGLEIKKLTEAFFARDMETAVKQHQKLMPLIKALFMTTNPIPVKAALNLAGILDVGDPRLPLIPLPEDMRKNLKEVLDQYTF